MTDTERLYILRKAYAKACQWIHDNPPGDLNMYIERPYYVETLAANKDNPDGRNWQVLFINEVLKGIRKDVEDETVV